MRKKLDGAKASASTEDCVDVRPTKESFKVAGPLLVVPRQIAFALMNCGSKLDLEPFPLQNLNPGQK
jgi:hypothetical protein